MRHWSIGARLTLWYSLILLAGLATFRRRNLDRRHAQFERHH